MPLHVSLRVQKPLQLVSKSGEAATDDQDNAEADEAVRLTAVRRIALEWRSAWDPNSGLNLPGTSLKYREGRARVHRLGGNKGKPAKDPQEPADDTDAASDLAASS